MDAAALPSSYIADISPRIGLPRNGPLEDIRVSKSKRKESRSILWYNENVWALEICVIYAIVRIFCSVENDTLDSDGFIEQELNDESKVNDFFQYAMNHKDRGVFVIFNHKVFIGNLAVDNIPVNN